MKGTTTAQVAFAEQKPINVPSKLLLFNGGEKGGKITWYAHAYFSNPITGAIVTTVTITKHKNGALRHPRGGEDPADHRRQPARSSRST